MEWIELMSAVVLLHCIAGPMYYKGVYHLFYQYNPNAAVWGTNIVWAHSVSADLIHWRHLPLPAIYPSKPFDLFGTWSGSATILPGNRPVILYTGVVDATGTQVQNYAVPANLSDPDLRDWIKPDDNPLIAGDESVDRTAFRDPTTAWRVNGGQWRIAVGGRWGQQGIAFLYKSRDFRRWVKVGHHLHEVEGTGNWECPDFFPVAEDNEKGLDVSAAGPRVKHVLKMSLDEKRYDYYMMGRYDSARDRYVPDSDMARPELRLRYDYGNFYASKSFFDPEKNRRVLWGWANESDATSDDISKGWAGIQADMEVIFSFDSLEKAEVFDPIWIRYDAQKLCGEKDSTVEGGLGPFGLITLASKNLKEYTPIFLRVFRDPQNNDSTNKYRVLMCSDASRSSLKDGKDRSNLKDGKDAYRPSFGGFVNIEFNKDTVENHISLRTLIDNSVVESFAERGKTCITSRVYPTLAQHENAKLLLFNNGSEPIDIKSFKAWPMSNARLGDR
ncbi:beta-fructofuranosidase, insoluble isoenzyme 1-like isoform X1 [Andrographis paniculata]|uniref:beta-fructofuranosidase, insoluble isoenzyme 1-like isoform X1 n=1 Tax=Andrographis paniculata TaxID=175694 RepID=UPI0021E862FA|nr:beta-fructofuranosidase, insoluble isoenzyme 1-like isoform X1 [Andrographis paniculata]